MHHLLLVVLNPSSYVYICYRFWGKNNDTETGLIGKLDILQCKAIPHPYRCSVQSRTYQQIFWFYVPVDNIETVQVLDSTCQVEQHRTGIALSVFVRRCNGIKEITPLEKECLKCERGPVAKFITVWRR